MKVNESNRQQVIHALICYELQYVLDNPDLLWNADELKDALKSVIDFYSMTNEQLQEHVDDNVWLEIEGERINGTT